MGFASVTGWPILEARSTCSSLGDHTQQRHQQNLQHIFDLQHVATPGPHLVKAGDEQMFLHPSAFLCLLRFAVEQTDDAI